MKIPSQWQETFDRKISDGEFSWKVNLLREAKQVRRQFLRSAEDDNESEKEWHEEVDGDTESKKENQGRKVVWEINSIF
jgi:hypothetical protein